MKRSKFSIDPSNPLITSFIVMLLLFWIGHFILTRLVYPAGEEITVVAGIVCGILAVLVLYVGYRLESRTWKGILGLCSGYFCWVVFAEVGETLGWGLEIGPANIPLNIVLGAILYLSVIHKKVILDPALIQGLNFFYVTWTVHVLDLVVYYSPVFGGPTPEMGEGATWGVWSQARLNASIILWVLELALLIFLLSQYIRPKFDSFRSVQARIGGGFWLLILFWSVAMEIPVKWFGIEMY